MPDIGYFPVLKGKQGEISALGLIDQFTKERILPVLELVPSTGDDAPDVKGVIDRTIARLTNVWNGRRLVLDAGYLNQEVKLGAGSGALGYAADRLGAGGVIVVPVVRPGDSAQTVADASGVQAEAGLGVALRLSVEDLDVLPEDVDATIDEMSERLGVRLSEIDVLLDLGAVEGGRSAKFAVRLLSDVLHSVTAFEDARRIVIVAGAFPSDLSDVMPGELSRLPRLDAAIYFQLGRRRTIRPAIFGDYAVSHPRLATPGPYRAAPQLRYTVAEDWLVLKGRVNDPKGHEQFYDIAEQVTRHPEFAGEALGTSDSRIAHARRDGRPGNASTWRMLGTAHHLDFTVRRLVELGEP